MAGRGPTPKANRNRSNQPDRGDWQPALGIGWQYGAVPTPPSKLLDASKRAWGTWFAAWFAAHWTPDDIPLVRQLVRLYDQVERGEFQRATEMRLLADTLGVSPKGQQDRRWNRPLAVGPASDDERPAAVESPYGRLRVVSE